jgi:hypothetical protein
MTKQLFQKGQSGNPGGRPKAVKDVVELARQAGPRVIERLIEIVTKPDSDDRAAVAAAKVLLDRGYGCATQTIALHDHRQPRAIVIVREGLSDASRIN